ncbi:MAG: antitoxin, partial [Janthinobacterium lividum]
MGIFDKARDTLEKHADAIDPPLDRVATEADQRKGGRHASQVDRVADLAKDELGDEAR